jgi:hypothetical protein
MHSLIEFGGTVFMIIGLAVSMWAVVNIIYLLLCKGWRI